MRKYPKYKESGYSWYGEIPEQWSVKDLKHELKFQTGGTPSTKVNSFYETDGKNTWVTISDLNGKFAYESKQCITEEGIKSANISLTPKGSLLYSFKLSVGQVAFAGKDLYTNEAIASFLPSCKYDLNFWYYSLPFSVIHNAEENIYGAKLLNQELIKNAGLIVPTKAEQFAIVQFLDHKTGQIDRFIANRQKQIELLKEQKAAIINKAVTKGINLSAKMKDSGIEWIGEVPEHWEIWKIKHTSYVKGRIGWDGLRSDEFFENEYAFLVTGTDFINGIVNWKSCYQITKERYLQDKHIQLKEDDLLITKDGTIGKTAVVKGLIGYASLNSGVFVVRPLRKYISEFLYFILNSDVFTQFINITTTGTTILHLYQNIFEIFEFTIPPIQEQQDIVDFIKEESEAIDTLISKYQKQIDLMQEYRMALISQAVTGKIDVRDWQQKVNTRKN